MDLSGHWRGASSSPELERSGADPDLDDSDWPPVAVPGHWGQSPEFESASGPLLYRRRFSIEPPTGDERRWLRFDGILSDAEVWLDGHHLGDVGVYYAAHRFDITDLLRSAGSSGDGEHVLAVSVSCGESGSGAKRTLTGSLQAGPLAPTGSPGGIWGDVGIDTTGPVSIVRASLLCLDATATKAVVQFAVVLDAAKAGPTRIDTSIVGPDGATAGGAAQHDLASGENHLKWTVRIEEPHLWWPAALGDQPSYDVTIAIRADGTTVSDRRHWRTGLRTTSVDDLQWRVNGERIFVKGVAVAPHSRFLASVDPAQFRDDVKAVRDAGLDLMRVHGHISRPELYRAADELGVLIWQDLPLVGTYATGARSGARSVARAVVDELGHHPSIVVWCGHEEPHGPPVAAPRPGVEPWRRRGRHLGHHLLPSWNRSVLDPSVRRALRSADPSRSVITRSGNLPSPVDFTSSDAHLWLGWHTGRAEDLASVIRRWPRLGTFIGAIGTQSAAIREWAMNAPDWPGSQRGAFARYVPRAAYSDGETWARAGRAYQAAVIRTQIETARRLKYNPTGGFCVVALFDQHADGGFGVLDADREAKPAFDAIVDACRPVVVIADLPPSIVTPHEKLSMAIHGVNDLREELGPVRISATARLDNWLVERRWEGHLEPDSCAFIGRLDFEVPNLTGALVIDLELETEDRIATNRYQTVVIPPSESMSPARS